MNGVARNDLKTDNISTILLIEACDEVYIQSNQITAGKTADASLMNELNTFYACFQPNNPEQHIKAITLPKEQGLQVSTDAVRR